MSAHRSSARSVRAASVAFAHHDAAPLFRDLTFDLGPGWTAVAGPNGAGKTTLLRLIAGELAPDAGQLVLEPRDARVAWARQAPANVGELVEAFSFDYGSLARRLRARLGLSPEMLERWPTLSPGERQRWQIAAALASEPDVLLLDEPVNHLDAGARQALAESLQGFVGVGLVVAHDRAFLDSICQRVLWIDRGGAHLELGTYTEVRERMHARTHTAQKTLREQKKHARRLSEEQERRKGSAAASERNISARRRIKGPKDGDARSMGAKFRAEKAAASHAKAVARLGVRVERATEAVAAASVTDELGGRLFVTYRPSPSSTLLRADLPPLVVGPRQLMEATTLVVRREDRIQLAGDNGAGKSTLLAALRAAWSLPEERLLTLPQELAPTARRDAVARLHALAPDERGRTLSMVAALGVDPARLLLTEEPSPGEARKLLLAEGLAREVWCVVLDEPTNHLDVPSIERLERALLEYPGALLLVSHDRHLAERTTDTVWTLADGRLDVQWRARDGRE